MTTENAHKSVATAPNASLIAISRVMTREIAIKA